MYKKYIKEELEKFSKEHPEMTFGQIIRAVITTREEGQSPLSWLFTVSDEDFYTAVENAITKEHEDTKG